MPAAAGLIAALGGGVALVGTYWDDAWHTDRGRDAFAIPPHLTLYGGVLMTALVLAGWGLLAWRRVGFGVAGLRRLFADRGWVIAGLGGGAVLVSAPIDNVWHALYGRDAVLWSPPHMLAVAGAVALSVGLLATLASSARRSARTTQILAAAGVMGAFLIPVMEYDSDVPQFPVVAYLPVATTGFLLAALVIRNLLPVTWPVTVAAAVYTGWRLVIVLWLGTLGMSLTAVPPVIVPAVVDDFLARRGASPFRRALAISIVLPLSWWPAAAVQRGAATGIPPSLLPVSVVLCAVTALGTLLLSSHRWNRRSAGGAVLTLLFVAVPWATVPGPPASAHDPGQGRQVGSAVLDATRLGDKVTITGRISAPDCPLRPVEAVARRAGVEIRASLTDLGGCRYAATLAVPDDGRWFLYINVAGPGARPLEAWIPMAAGKSSVRKSAVLYEPPGNAPGVTRDASGLLLYAVVVMLVVATVRLAGTVTPARAV
jgi:hypothetical protein